MMADILGEESRKPIDVAQKIMYDAWDIPDRKARIELAYKAVEISRDCADAYVLLAEEEAGTLERAIDLYCKGTEAGERALGKRAFKEDVGHFWGILETRPYMRARCGLAQCLWMAGQHTEAVGHFWELLRLNPNDNQGIRYLLAASLLHLRRDEEVAGLLHRYKEDASAAWAYTSALLTFRKEGDTELSRLRLSEALENNPHIPDFLLGKAKSPRDLPEHVGRGDETEAVWYVGAYASGWEKTPGALAWLAGQVQDQ